ncbi:MAG: LytTR family transcriptional regulator DNA-binding domain-containing protein [Bradyrhizobiaceae bacterium]|nr:LytTR family transcriptional regulator DNA-binding domain-containing protein [Bradyrhizobiaceae bacterium]
MLIRILLVVPEQVDEDLRTMLHAHPKHNLAMLGRVDHEVAVESIKRFVPDMVIVDADADGGALIKSWPDCLDERTVLVCMARDVSYALDAFLAGAVHYLLQPVNDGSAEEAVSRAAIKLHAYDLARMSDGSWPLAMPPTPQSQAPFRCQVIALPNSASIAVRNPDELVSAHGEGNYTRVMLREEAPVILSRSLGDLEPELTHVGLLRVHRSHMVNVDMIRSINRGKQPSVHLVNGLVVDVGAKYRDALYTALHISRYVKR